MVSEEGTCRRGHSAKNRTDLVTVLWAVIIESLLKNRDVEWVEGSIHPKPSLPQNSPLLAIVGGDPADSLRRRPFGQ